jgi:hypothetical protein
MKNRFARKQANGLRERRVEGLDKTFRADNFLGLDNA